mmetsp:Transcript_55621/g.64996  ORF Transcript_55621/g.64996 Transcript_55621/m.64996 type:complete len:473 (+) Transcript_55621:34-1452(+)|eukprot:CAMPEP_0194379106 /NCGR_PEP_ID=MMETSP0174-20130528/38021_1 /TAXON_ID=216777 /ORGANISM="Proboscia alata, Strain PI-D3" /LENGTH=472 /DNA_ID=CAMNT_0039161579 /DNA_START=33 /DNA_END=1454 /DNA_ORIENTATION=+
MDAKVEQFYRQIFADLKISNAEDAAVKSYFSKINPPPDKCVWLRAAAFRIGSEFLSDDRDKNVQLLRCVNAVVHALEYNCLVPKKREHEDPTDELESKVADYYREILTDLSIDSEENVELQNFFSENSIPLDKLVYIRASAFKIGSEYLNDDKAKNISLFRCINVIVHVIEQRYFESKPYVLEVTHSPTQSVKSIGLNSSIQKALQHIWNLDHNRLTPDKDYVINVQKGKKPYQKFDGAPDPLFTSVERSAFQRPTYRTFIALLDNYVAEVGNDDTISSHERREIWSFIRAIMQTAPMQFAHKYCAAQDENIPNDLNGFSKLIYDIWFEPYKRSHRGKPDSSGFEHVFVGEIKNDKVTGFHNWIRFYLEEKKGNIDYRGYIKPRNKRESNIDSNDQALSIQFLWNGYEKFVGSSFIGVSPEFEMALYTVCFLIGEEETTVEIETGNDLFDLHVKCFKMARGKVGTSYVEIVG